MKHWKLYFVIALTTVIILSGTHRIRAGDLADIRLPPGFKIEVYADKVRNARGMALGPDGVVYVGTRRMDRVYAIPDADGDRRGDRVVVIARKLTMPNGVAVQDGYLYVAERSRIIRYPANLELLEKGAAPEIVYDGYPDEDHHGWKYIAFGPDGYLYVPVGAPCNICEEKDERFASITRFKPGGEPEVFARGIRNTVGFDWHPVTGELWFTNNGRDWMGDDLPPETLNIAPEKGLHFGFPYCHAGNVPDPEFGKKRACSEFTPPALKMPAHVAPLGMKFYRGTAFPKEYRGIFIAEHGSWNRSTPVGFRITHVSLKNGRPDSYTVFAEGWLQGKSSWGRPVDVLELPDGSLLVSDDKAGAIYRISYVGT